MRLQSAANAMPVNAQAAMAASEARQIRAIFMVPTTLFVGCARGAWLDGTPAPRDRATTRAKRDQL